MPIPDKVKKLLEAKSFAYIATVSRDGSPQVTPVWVEHDGTHIIVNSEKTRVKVRNMQRDARVALSVANPDNPYEYTQIKGRVVEVTPEGGFEGIDRLAKKYIGQDKYPWNQPDDVRVQIKIVPERYSGQG